MKRLWSLLALLLLLVAMTGCSNHSSYMSPVQSLELAPLPEGKASVTFFRYSSYGFETQAPIAMEIPHDIEFVGIASVDTKIRQIVDAGDHVWVVGGESGALIKGHLLAGKNYYVRIEPQLGWWKARFKGHAMTVPLLADPKVQKQLATCKYVEIGESGHVWFGHNKASMMKKLHIGKAKWKKASDNSACYITPSDGVDEVY